MEIEEAYIVPSLPCEGFGLGLIEQPLDPLQVIHAADEQNSRMFLGQLLQSEGHPLFPQQVLPVRAACRPPSEFLIIGGQPQTVHEHRSQAAVQR